MLSVPAVWRAPVRFAEVDLQGVVFHAHYLTYCDEAFPAFLTGCGIDAQEAAGFSARVQLVTSTLLWSSAATFGDIVEVDAECSKVGRTSLGVLYEVRVGQRLCCEVSTTYVHVGSDGTPAPIPANIRAILAPP